MRPLARAALVALCAAAGALRATAQDLAASRARWEQKSEEERAVLRARFAELQKLAPDERRALEDLAQKLKQHEAAVEESLPEDVRAQLADLPPEERSGVFREHVQGVLRHRGEDVRARLPEELLKSIEAEKPLHRPLRLEGILKHERPLGAREVRRLGESLGAPEEELRGLEDLGQAELEDRALSFHRAALDRAVQRLGPPPGLDAAGYAQLRRASHAEFFRRWRALDPPPAYDERGERAEPREPARPTQPSAPTEPSAGSAASEPDGPGVRSAPSARRAPSAPSAPTTPTTPTTIGERTPGRGTEAQLDARERARLLARLRRLTEPPLEERVAQAHLPESERREALSAAVEARVLAFIAEHDLFTPEEEALLRANSGPRFPEAARRLAAAKERRLREEARPQRPERASRAEAGGARGDRR